MSNTPASSSRSSVLGRSERSNTNFFGGIMSADHFMRLMGVAGLLVVSALGSEVKAYDLDQARSYLESEFGSEMGFRFIYYKHAGSHLLTDLLDDDGAVALWDLH